MHFCYIVPVIKGTLLTKGSKVSYGSNIYVYCISTYDIWTCLISVDA